MTEEAESAATTRAFRELCVQYEDLLDETTEFTQPVDERIGLALFKIDEACSLTDGVRQDSESAREHLLHELGDNCRVLEDIFIRINLIEVRLLVVFDSRRDRVCL